MHARQQPRLARPTRLLATGVAPVMLRSMFTDPPGTQADGEGAVNGGDDATIHDAQ